MTGYLLLALTCLLTTAGQLCQKEAAQRWRLALPHEGRLGQVARWLFLACLLLGLGMLSWLAVLRLLPVSQAYPMLSLNFVLVVLAARLIYKEQTTPRHWGGVAAICAGVALMGLSS